MLGFQVGMDFESMAKLWLNDKNADMLILLLMLCCGVYGK
jgi:hypothetical protein